MTGFSSSLRAASRSSVARSAGARAISFLPTAVATLLTSRLIIQRFGIHSFDSFALIITLISLVPLNNLGVGAAVTASYAADGPSSERSRRVTLTAARTLTVSTVGTAAASMALAAAGLWPTLLGAASGPNLYCGLAVAIYAVSFLPGLGQSMLLGVHRNHVSIIVQTLFTPLILVGTLAVIELGVTGDAVMLVPPAALVVVNVVTSWLAARASGISWLWILRSLPGRRRHLGAPIRAMSGPMLLITLATPIALQSDRIVLSHASTTQAVANYSILLQVFGPGLALIAASASPLWPIYAEARARGEHGPSKRRVLLSFTAAAIAIGAPLALLANPIGELIGGHRIELGVALPIVGAATLITAALAHPTAMMLMDPQGVRVVSALTVGALPVNIALSIVLAERLGAPGPLVATIAVGILVQTVPALVYAARRRPAGRHRASRENTVGAAEATGRELLLQRAEISPER